MLNIGKLRSGGENYYLNSVARGVEDYYLGSGEAPGYWLASGAADVGLTGEVTEAALRNVLEGSDPVSGDALVAPRKGERIPGFDLTFRAPKSVALLHALGPKEASNDVVSAHDAAVAASLGYLERVASGARRGKGGKISIESRGFIGAAFRHRTSRAGDPLLHTHVLVANLIHGSDERWGAVDARHLYLHAKTAGYLYQSHLRSELTRRLGVRWGPVRNGAADLEGVPREVIRAFSRRRREVEQASGGAEAAGGRRGQVAALATRKAKDYEVSPEALLPEWRLRAQSLGLASEDLEALVGQSAYQEPTAEQRTEVERELSSESGLTAQTSTFSRREVIQGCSRRSSRRCDGRRGRGVGRPVPAHGPGGVSGRRPDQAVPLVRQPDCRGDARVALHDAGDARHGTPLGSSRCGASRGSSGGCPHGLGLGGARSSGVAVSGSGGDGGANHDLRCRRRHCGRLGRYGQDLRARGGARCLGA